MSTRKIEVAVRKRTILFPPVTTCRLSALCPVRNADQNSAGGLPLLKCPMPYSFVRSFIGGESGAGPDTHQHQTICLCCTSVSRTPVSRTLRQLVALVAPTTYNFREIFSVWDALALKQERLFEAPSGGGRACGRRLPHLVWPYWLPVVRRWQRERPRRLLLCCLCRTENTLDSMPCMPLIRCGVLECFLLLLLHDPTRRTKKFRPRSQGSASGSSRRKGSLKGASSSQPRQDRAERRQHKTRQVCAPAGATSKI